CDLFHRAADELRPIYNAALALVPASPDVHADETSIRQQGLDRRAFLWHVPASTCFLPVPSERAFDAPASTCLPTRTTVSLPGTPSVPGARRLDRRPRTSDRGERTGDRPA
ncbi:MAG TPA: transposase, partial [Polyangiaceae bacterium]